MLLFAFLLPSSAIAQERTFPLKLDVQVGWGEALRPGRWTPIFVTTSDPAATDSRPRAVRLELQAGQPQPGIMTTSGTVAVGPRPTTFTLYAPPRDEGGDELVVVLRDANSGQMLALWPEGTTKERRWARPSVSNRIVAGYIGQGATRLDMLSEAAGNRVAFVTLAAAQLPDRPIGLDQLDLLILDRPDLGRLSRDRQQAIVDWVRSGGTLLLWPSGEPGGSSPLADVLPCRIGESRSMVFSPERRQQAGITNDTPIQLFQLRPLGGTTRPVFQQPQEIPLLADASGKSELIAFTSRLGFGRITLCPFDPGELQFASVESGRTFYQALTRRLGVFEPQPETFETISFGADNLVRRQDHASAVLESMLVPENRDVPFGWIGTFGWLVLGIAFFVGPVDAITLRLCGRRGLTPVTTIGWIALLAAVGALLWNPAKKQSPRLATVELIDQSDDQVVARQLLAAVTDGREQQIQFKQPGTPASGSVPAFWQLPARQEWTGRGRRFDFPFRQTLDGVSPAPVHVRGDQPISMSGELVAGGNAPLISAELTVSGDGATNVRGTIRNVSPHSLSDVRICLGQEFAAPAGGASPSTSPSAGSDWSSLAASPVAVAKLAPGETVKIDLPLQLPGTRNAPSDAGPSSSESAVWAVAGDLNARRSWRAGIESARDCAVIYANVDQPAPMELDVKNAAPSKHRAVLRALVPVQ